MDSLKPIEILVAATHKTYGIGKNGTLPWNLPKEMAFFKNTTLTTTSPDKINAIIMGRKTWESIPPHFRPLSGRINVVLSNNPHIKDELNIPDNVFIQTSLSSALQLLSSSPLSETVEKIFVIGGSSVFREAVASAFCQKIHITLIKSEDFECDTFFDPIPDYFHLSWTSGINIEKGIEYTFNTFLNSNMTEQSNLTSQIANENSKLDELCDNLEERQYLDLIKDIIENGVQRGDRTGTGTLSKFGVQMRFNLKDNQFPLFTSKRVFWRGVAEELLWFISGSTNGNLLSEKDIHIWDSNGSREFLDKLGLHHREVGDLGPVYGFQWRHFGAKYVDMYTNYTGEGVDQLARVIETLKTNPNDRRIVLSAWNPSDLDLMALPPCHMFCQFYVANGELSCQMYQRSADMGLGIPFNVASYALLTRMIAHVCDLKPGEFIHVIGDAHVYLNHVEPLREQLQRAPRSFPKLFINPQKKDIDSFTFEDFTIEDYRPCPPIKMKMAV